MYAVKHKETGLFFTGFDRKNEPKWGCVEAAEKMSKSDAKLQAALFASFGLNVQKKPEAV